MFMYIMPEHIISVGLCVYTVSQDEASVETVILKATTASYSFKV